MDQLEGMEEHPASDAESEARMRRLAEALVASDSRYERNDSAFEGVPVIGLMAEGGIQIDLMSDHATFNFPYWDSLDVQRITTDISRAAGLIKAQTGWDLYDPQLDKFIEPDEAAAEIEAAFDYGREALSEITKQDELEPLPFEQRKPFWKRLFGR